MHYCRMYVRNIIAQFSHPDQMYRCAQRLSSASSGVTVHYHLCDKKGARGYTWKAQYLRHSSEYRFWTQQVTGKHIKVLLQSVKKIIS